MASNDTNSWDEDAHERMRQRWQQAFADHRMAARPALTRRIFNSLNTGRGHRRGYRAVTVLAGLLLLLGVVDLDPPVKRPHRAASNVHFVAPAVQPAHPVEQTLPPIWGIHTPAVPAVAPRPVPASSSPDVRGAKALAATLVAARPAPTKSTFPAHKPLLTRPSAHKTSAPDAIWMGPVSRGARNAGKVSPIGDAYRIPQSGPVANQSRRDSVRAEGPTLTDAAVGYTLAPLTRLPPAVSLSNRRWQLPELTALAQAPTSSRIARGGWRWFAQISPLSHFQRMIAPPNASAHLSSVEAPAAFSPTTWGLQVTGGMRWQHWQLQGSLGYLRRWAYYTVSENRYHVAARPGNPHQLVRDTYSVSENKLLPLVGLGLSRQQLLLRGRYTAELGGQVAYLPSIDQSLLALRGVVARRLLMGQGGGLQVGLQVEYGLSQLHDAANQLTLRPFVIGVGLRVQPGLKQPAN